MNGLHFLKWLIEVEDVITSSVNNSEKIEINKKKYNKLPFDHRN